MTSSASSANPLGAYLAGRLSAEDLVKLVVAQYYRETSPKGRGQGTRDTWRPIMDVIERAHPGVVELKASDQRPGFDVRLAERPFPKRYEADLRAAVAAVGPFPGEAPPRPGLLQRIVRAIRRVFKSDL